MPSAIWTGTIGFGLVQVPVRLVSATKSQDVRFNQLDADSGARIRYRKVSEATGEEVPADKIVKGYEISPGSYVTVEPDELSAIAPKSTHTIEIEEFVDLDKIDPLYFDSPYYLAPDPKGEKPYRLLVAAMEELGKVAIGRVVMRSKERLVAIRPLDGVLCVETMRYDDEVLDASEHRPSPGDAPSDKEREMAAQLVEALSVDEFEPEKFHDEYREQLLDLIERKAGGEQIVASPAAAESDKILDLVAALEASLARTGKDDADTDSKTDADSGEAAAAGA